MDIHTRNAAVSQFEFECGGHIFSAFPGDWRIDESAADIAPHGLLIAAELPSCEDAAIPDEASASGPYLAELSISGVARTLAGHGLAKLARLLWNDRDRRAKAADIYARSHNSFDSRAERARIKQDLCRPPRTVAARAKGPRPVRAARRSATAGDDSGGSGDGGSRVGGGHEALAHALRAYRGQIANCPLCRVAAPDYRVPCILGMSDATLSQPIGPTFLAFSQKWRDELESALVKYKSRSGRRLVEAVEAELTGWSAWADERETLKNIENERYWERAAQRQDEYEDILDDAWKG